MLDSLYETSLLAAAAAVSIRSDFESIKWISHVGYWIAWWNVNEISRCAIVSVFLTLVRFLFDTILNLIWCKEPDTVLVFCRYLFHRFLRCYPSDKETIFCEIPVPVWKILDNYVSVLQSNGLLLMLPPLLPKSVHENWFTWAINDQFRSRRFNEQSVSYCLHWLTRKDRFSVNWSRFHEIIVWNQWPT